MKEYKGSEMQNKGSLLNSLRKPKCDTILYVNDCYFALDIGEVIEFYYNPQFLWKRIDKSMLSQDTIEYLSNNCAVFKNFDPDKDYQETVSKFWYKSDLSNPEIPNIGNYYNCLGKRIITSDNQFIIFPDDSFAKTIPIDTITEYDLKNMLFGTVTTNTPNYIRDIYELDCFIRTKKVLKSNTIIGAIAGDIIGSTYEFNNVKSLDFNLFPNRSKFTDDTILTVAIADCILNNKDLTKTVWEYGRKYRGRGYGGKFKEWLKNENPLPYNSFGNGSAMRVSSVGFAYDKLETVLQKAKETAEITHNHLEGIKGAQSTAAAIYLAKTGKSKAEIKDYISTTFDYNLDFTLEQIRQTYKFDVTCQGSVPQAIVAFLESSDYESSIRLAISIGGDSDTIACITGGISLAYYKEIPEHILKFAANKLSNEFIDILNEFDNRFNNR